MHRQLFYKLHRRQCHVNGQCLVAYQAKKNKNPVELLSSSRSDNLVAINKTKNPVMILDYNKRKGGVDISDENLEEFSCRRKAVRRPLLFFAILLMLQQTMRAFF